MPVTPTQQIISELAPTGALRAAINMGNFLLVTGKDPSGDPTGVSPDMAAAIAARLGVPVKYVPYDKPGELADDAVKGLWDIGNIGAEPQRAQVITFTAAYCEIEATYLVPPGSTIKSVGEVDAPGKKIAVTARSAYCLWLENNLKQAQLVQYGSADEAIKQFTDEKMDAYAGLRPGLDRHGRENAGRAHSRRAVRRGAAGRRHTEKERRGLRVPQGIRRGIEEQRADRQPDRAAWHGRPPVCRAEGLGNKTGREPMKASILSAHGGPEMLHYGDIADPVAGPGEVVVDVYAASVNAADYKVRLGSYDSKLKFPYILGRDFSGIVARAARVPIWRSAMRCSACSTPASRAPMPKSSRSNPRSSPKSRQS